MPEQSQTPLDILRKDIADIQRCLLYTSDAADDLLCVDLGGRRLIKKKNYPMTHRANHH